MKIITKKANIGLHYNCLYKVNISSVKGLILTQLIEY